MAAVVDFVIFIERRSNCSSVVMRSIEFMTSSNLTRYNSGSHQSCVQSLGLLIRFVRLDPRHGSSFSTAITLPGNSLILWIQTLFVTGDSP